MSVRPREEEEGEAQEGLPVKRANTSSVAPSLIRSMIPLLRCGTDSFPGDAVRDLEAGHGMDQRSRTALKEHLVDKRRGMVLVSRPSGNGLTRLVVTHLRKQQRRHILVLYPGAWTVSLQASTTNSSSAPTAEQGWDELQRRHPDALRQANVAFVFENLEAVPVSFLPAVLEIALDLGRTRLVVCTTSAPHLRPLMAKRSQYTLLRLESPQTVAVVASLAQEFQRAGWLESANSRPISTPLGKALGGIIASNGYHMVRARRLLCQLARLCRPDQSLDHPDCVTFVERCIPLCSSVPQMESVETYRTFCQGLARRPLEQLLSPLDGAPQILLSFLLTSIFQRNVPLGGPAPLRFMGHLLRRSLLGFCSAVRQDTENMRQNTLTQLRMGPSAPLIHLSSVLGGAACILRLMSKETHFHVPSTVEQGSASTSSSHVVQNTHYRVWQLMMRVLVFWQQGLVKHARSSMPEEALWDISFLSQWVIPWSVLPLNGRDDSHPAVRFGRELRESQGREKALLTDLWIQPVVSQLSGELRVKGGDDFAGRGTFHLTKRTPRK